MKDIEEEVKKFLDEKQTPSLSLEEMQTMLNEVYDDKKQEKPSRLIFWQRFAIACCCLLVIFPCVLLPILLKPQDEPYYGEDEVTKTELTLDYVQDFIEQNYAQYSFIFEDCTVKEIYSFNEITTNKLVAISLVLTKTSIPRTVVKFDLILDTRFKFSQDEKYTQKAEITKYDNFTLYVKNAETLYDTKLLALKDCTNYKLYLEFNLPDEEFLEKFL